MSDAPASTQRPATSLSRELNLFHLTMMGVGMMIGAGAVIGMGYSVSIAGPGGTLVAFALDGLVALFTAMSYAEMSSAVPKAGSIYNFGRIAFGRSIGFTSGWMAWFASSVAGSFYAVICAEYVVDYLAKLGLLGWVPVGFHWQVRLFAVALSLLFVFINYRGVSSTGKAASLLTLGQTLTLGFIGFYGVAVFILDPGRLANFTPFVPRGWSAVFVCMGFEFIAFEGYEVIAEAGDEAIDPRRNLPKAILYAVLIVTFTYVIVAFSLIAGVKDVGMPAWRWIAGFGERGFGEAMARLMPLGTFIAMLTVIFAATSALNATVYSAARVSYALGRDRMLPRMFGRISPRRSTPHIALAATTVIVVACIFLPIIDLASASSIMFLFMFLLANLCVIKMRGTMREELQYGYLMPFFPLIPLVAIAMQLLLAVFIVNVSWLAWVIAPGWILCGLAIFFTYSRTRAAPIREEILTVEETPAPSPGGYRILFPVADVDTTLTLIPQALRLAEARKGVVELLHLVSIPDQVPLSDAAAHALAGQEAMTEAMLYLSSASSVAMTILCCRNVARGILFQARAWRPDLLLLGWQGSKSLGDFVFGRTLDPVVANAPCDVAVLTGGGRPPFKRVLVPVAGGPNSALALEMAALMAEPGHGTVIALHVRRPGTAGLDVEQLTETAAQRIGAPGERFASRVIVSPDARASILEQVEHADLVVLGATGSAFWSRVLSTSLPEDIARSCDKPLIVVRARRTGRRRA